MAGRLHMAGRLQGKPTLGVFFRRVRRLKTDSLLPPTIKDPSRLSVKGVLLRRGLSSARAGLFDNAARTAATCCWRLSCMGRLALRMPGPQLSSEHLGIHSTPGSLADGGGQTFDHWKWFEVCTLGVSATRGIIL